MAEVGLPLVDILYLCVYVFCVVCVIVLCQSGIDETGFWWNEWGLGFEVEMRWIYDVDS